MQTRIRTSNTTSVTRRPAFVLFLLERYTLLNELGVDNTSFIIMEDNIPCIKYTEEPRSHQRMKHLDLKYMFIRELVRNKKLKVEYISTVDQPADAFTKGLPVAQHRKLLNILNVRIVGRC